MTRRRIMAIDPGGTTGWCFWDGHALRGHGQCGDWVEFCNFFERYLDEVDEVVIEVYQITMETVKKTRQYEPLMIIGVVVWLCDKHGKSLKIQSRGVKSFSTDNKLKKMGWFFKGEQHARDAARHLLAYLWDNDLIEAERFLDDGES